MHAIDSGLPIRETAATTVVVTIVDVNNKPPEFKNSTYIAYVSEKAAIGKRMIDRFSPIFRMILTHRIEIC